MEKNVIAVMNCRLFGRNFCSSKEHYALLPPFSLLVFFFSLFFLFSTLPRIQNPISRIFRAAASFGRLSRAGSLVYFPITSAHVTFLRGSRINGGEGETGIGYADGKP